MKVLHVIPSVSPLHGGPSFVVKRMTAAMASLGASVDVATTTADGSAELDVPLGQPLREDGVRYFYFPRQQPKFWTFSWPLTRWLARNAESYDVLHVHALFSYPTLPACWAARHRGVPYVLRPLGTLDPWSLRHGRWKKELYFRVFERRNLSGAAAVHAVSELERRAIQRLGLPVQVVTVPLGIDVPTASSQPHQEIGHTSENDRVKVLFLSRLHPKKGLELLLEALELLPSEMAVHLVVAGDGEPSYVRRLRDRAAAIRARAQITFRGFVAGEEKRRLLEQANLFVLPSYDENFGLAAAEALGAGLPVIVSQHVGLADQIATAGAGLVVPCDPVSLSRALATLIEAPARRLQMSKAARRLAEGFSWPVIARQLLALYEVVGTNGASARRKAPEAFRA